MLLEEGVCEEMLYLKEKDSAKLWKVHISKIMIEENG